MIQAKVDTRKRLATLTREITYQRVLLAVYMLSDDDGVACDVPVARIGLECGHGISSVQRSIAEMIRRGVVVAVDQRHGLNRRILVLADHPSADSYIADVKARIDAKFQAEMKRRVERVAARRGRT